MNSTTELTARPFDMSIRGFLTAAASSAPTPGGGSVAALVAALGASMTSMVANLSQGPKFAELAPGMQALSAAMGAAIGQLEELLQADVECFNAYMAALRLPKATDEEKAARRSALQAATVAATEVPFQLADACLDALVQTHHSAAMVNGQVLSDLGIAAMLLDAAGQSALLTADINIPSIADAAIQGPFLQRRNLLAQRLVETRAETMGVVRQRMAGE